MKRFLITGPAWQRVNRVFVGKENSDAEDAGYLMTFLCDLTNASTEFVVMDAQDFDRGYVAKVKVTPTHSSAFTAIGQVMEHVARVSLSTNAR